MLKHGAKLFAALAVLCTFFASAAPVMAQAALDPQLGPYRPGLEPIKGRLKLIGSETMSGVAAVWKDSFERFHPDVTVEVVVKGSINAVNSVRDGEAHFGLLSREVLAEEIKEFTDKKGYPPHMLVSCLERQAIYVHIDNPIQGLTVAQLDAIFSSTLKRGAKKQAQTWGDLGISGPMAAQPISCFVRSPTTGSQIFFQEVVLMGGEFHKGCLRQEDNLEMVKNIAKSPSAVGFAGATYEYPGTKAVPIATQEGGEYFPIDCLPSATGSYPLVRPLQLVVNHAPKTKLSPLEGEFIKYVFSRMGQEDVVKAGFTPVSSKPAQIALDSVDLKAVE
ncbi:PstS family phosphate ABC transporter substrate-binding protein [Planctomyces sp. SH-PL14]|uniref:PstS family phosphate ABC transporter substrate-binding protein n=1 Tax=Planctomyces sp. SH-PL14 TaxID=1632864 RepID=UPI00078DA31F|nr:substrate-binding domain-containing protein [Planctomyces sp. SH-PL14]AMV21898.1 Phosphate-binding protein PstS precursor [Planctomyces sp. SH-PL14]